MTPPRPPFNPYNRMREADKPYEIWQTPDGDKEWHVVRKHCANDDDPEQVWEVIIKQKGKPEKLIFALPEDVKAQAHLIHDGLIG